jgi:hypothetical protein
MGAPHGVDLPFLFKEFERTFLGAGLFRQDHNDPEIQRLGRIWSDRLLRLSRTGDPNGGGLPVCRPYSVRSKLSQI